MFDWILTIEGWIAFSSLVSLEIVLGIDNIIFISILVNRLPHHQRDQARIIGLALALVSRLVLLAGLFWIVKLTVPVFTLSGQAFSWRDIVLVIGGLFLIAKATFEIHHSLEIDEASKLDAKTASFAYVIAQIMLIDVIFSLDSVITAVGMVKQISIMVLAVLISIAVMLLASKPISKFVDQNPTIKVLALAFLILIGVTLVAEALGAHVPKGYIYFAMAFSLSVELLNIRTHRKKNPAPIELSNFFNEKNNDQK